MRTPVRVVTEYYYTRSNIKANPYAILEPLVIFARANDESRTKSYGGKGRWEARRRAACMGGKKVSKNVPAWLELSEDRRSFHRKPEAVETVRRIFTLACDGPGCPGIARTLHVEGVPTIGTVSHWNHEYVHKILKSRAVLGGYQPNRKVEGKRVPDGEPIVGYYPAILGEATWFRAEAAILDRRRVRGRPSRPTNLIGGLIHDAYDGSPMHVRGRGGEPTFVSSKALRGEPGAVWRGYRYDHLERSFLRFVTDLRPEDSMPTKVAPDEASEIAGQLQVLAHKIQVIQDRIAREDAIESLVDVLTRLEGERRVLEERLEEIKRRRVTGGEQTLGEVQSVAALLDSTPPEEIQSLRSRLDSKIRSLVEAIYLRVYDELEDPRVAMVEVIVHDDSGRFFPRAAKPV